MPLGLIGLKLGHTRVYDANGVATPVTVVLAGPNRVLQVKTNDTDGYNAVQLAFGDQKIGRLAKHLNEDALRVMDVVCQDTRLNISRYYMRPGTPFGGSCLPKDVRALTNLARSNGLSLPMLENLLSSNERHLSSLLHLITETEHREVVILGLSFKSNTDDLRESPMVDVAQALLGRGYKLRIYDPALNLAALVGANKRVIDTKMPHLASLLHTDLATAIGPRGLIVAAQKCAPLAELKKLVTANHLVLDVNGWADLKELPAKYEGLCW
mgnify:CR=1 FL=1